MVPAATGPAGLCRRLRIAAGVCSLLAFANAPVGPTAYSPALTGLRPLLASGSTLVLASCSCSPTSTGAPYIAWELRGGRVCIEPASEAGGGRRTAIRFFVTSGDSAEAAVPVSRPTPSPGPTPLGTTRRPSAAPAPAR